MNKPFSHCKRFCGLFTPLPRAASRTTAKTRRRLGVRPDTRGQSGVCAHPRRGSAQPSLSVRPLPAGSLTDAASPPDPAGPRVAPGSPVHSPEPPTGRDSTQGAPGPRPAKAEAMLNCAARAPRHTAVVRHGHRWHLRVGRQPLQVRNSSLCRCGSLLRSRRWKVAKPRGNLSMPDSVRALLFCPESSVSGCPESGTQPGHSKP